MIILLITAMIAGIFYSVPTMNNVVYAQEMLDAVTIPLNERVTASVNEGYEYEQNYYRIEVSQPGMLEISFYNQQQNESKSYWRIGIYDSSYNEIYMQEIKGNVTETILPQIGLDKGTYYIEADSSSWYYAMSTEKFSFVPKFNQSNYWEKEKNNEYRTATQIESNGEYYGSALGNNSYDIDYYKFSVSQAGVIKPLFYSAIQKDSSDYWKIYLYNEEYTEICNMNIYGNRTETKLPEIGIPSGTYYFRVESSKYYSSDAAKDTYSFDLNYSQSSNWEQEPNEDYTSATKITIGNTFFGSTDDKSGEEKDFFCFDVETAGRYLITMTTSNLGSTDSYWDVYLYDSLYSEITSFNVYGNKTEQSIERYLEPGKYYLRVKSKSYDKVPGVSTSTYGICVSATKPTVVDAYVSNYKAQYTYTGEAIKPSVTVTLGGKTLKKGTDYTISYSNNKNVGDATFTIKGKGDYRGSITRTFGIFPQATTLKNISKLKGGFKVKWKKKKAQVDGYIIEYSRYKSMEMSSKHYVRSARTTSESITGLYSKRIYYVRIRTYKDAGNGYNYLSERTAS